jgi:hypothetical protein
MRRIVNNPELTDLKSRDVGGLRKIPITATGRFRIMTMVKYIMDVSYKKLEYVWMHNLECMSMSLKECLLTS